MGRNFLTLLEDNRNIKPNDIEQLSKKINGLDRKVSQWDFYNIQSVVQDKEEFASAFAKLLPNSALVIDAEAFSEGKDSYNRGDIVYKATNLEMIHINAERGGMFFPSQIQKEQDQYSLSYSYSVAAPEAAEKKVNIAEKVDKPYTSITFTGLTQTENQPGYNLSFTWKSGEIITFKKVETLRPYIKFYCQDDKGNLEEVSCDFNLSENTEKTDYILSDVSSIVTYVVIR